MFGGMGSAGGGVWGGATGGAAGAVVTLFNVI